MTYSSFFFFNDTATTEIYTLSLHDALPILTFIAGARRSGAFEARTVPSSGESAKPAASFAIQSAVAGAMTIPSAQSRSEEHTSELQSRQYLVCRLLLEKKKKTKVINIHIAL